MADPRIVLSPPASLTHQELLIDFFDLPAEREFRVNVTGPLAQPYWATLKTDPTGRAQLFWRTQAAGEYAISAKGDDIALDGAFTVSDQPGAIDVVQEADVKSVEDPELMVEKPKPEPKKPTTRRKPGPRKSR